MLTKFLHQIPALCLAKLRLKSASSNVSEIFIVSENPSVCFDQASNLLFQPILDEQDYD